MTTFWFILIAFLWTGYFVLEGFDFGVGALMPVLARGEAERRQVLRTIGPVWDGNEVWLITAIGAMFAAFPAWYAGFLSQFYLAAVMVVLGLIVRGVGLEWRGKVRAKETPLVDAAIVAGSVLPAFLWGAIFGNVLFASAFATVMGGLLSLGLALVHGAVFVALKTKGPVRARAREIAWVAGVVLVPVVAFALWRLDAWPAYAAMAAYAAGVGLVWAGKEAWAFACTAVTIVLTTAATFLTLYPEPLPGLTVESAASAPYTLTVLTWIGLIALPGVIAYQAWTYWVFRKRLTAPEVLLESRSA